MDKLKTFFQTKPLFLYLLPVFFVLHGFTEHYPIISYKDALLLIAKYLSIAVLLSLVCWLLFRNLFKANILAFCLLAYHFLFGSLYDFINSNFSKSFITKYSFIISISLLVFFLLILYLKKSKKGFSIISKYLNILFLVLVLVDIGNLVIKITGKKTPLATDLSFKNIKCDTCSKPDIYLIIADEYAGKQELKDIFSFDNTQFEENLRSRGFHITTNSISNYNWTVYSMASLLNMTYLENLSSDIINNRDMFRCTDLIETNNVTKLLKENGYSLLNYSFFDVSDDSKEVKSVFLPTKKALITAQTFTNRITKAFGFHFMTQKQIASSINLNLYNNIKIDSLTREASQQKAKSPRFIYSHLVMPHYRYYFDSKGHSTAFDKVLDDSYCSDKKAYLEYLQYSNVRLLSLIDEIKKTSATPPVIILMSDHGYRQFTSEEDKKNTPQKYYFMNLNAVLLPNGDYSLFYNGMSNVNQFRIVFNTLFKQNIPLLKDSTFFLKD